MLWLINFSEHHSLVSLGARFTLYQSALGILLSWTSSMPGTTFFSGIAAKFGLAFFASSTFLNMTLSCMICYRLLRHARTVKKYLGDRHASPYIAIVMLVVESMLPFTFSNIAFLVSYGMLSQDAVVFSFVHPLMMVRSRTPLFESENGANKYVVCLTTDAHPPRSQRRGMAKGRNWDSSINYQGPFESWTHAEHSTRSRG